MGGVDEFRIRQRSLDESVDMICGIAMAHQGREIPSAMVNFKSIYAGKPYIITHVVRNNAYTIQLVYAFKNPSSKQLS
jgi:hypothetical protein